MSMQLTIECRRLLDVVLSHNDGKPTLVFCTTRKECVNAAMALVKNPVGPHLNGRQPFVRGEARGELIAASRKAVDKSLQGAAPF